MADGSTLLNAELRYVLALQVAFHSPLTSRLICIFEFPFSAGRNPLWPVRLIRSAFVIPAHYPPTLQPPVEH